LLPLYNNNDDGRAALIEKRVSLTTLDFKIWISIFIRIIHVIDKVVNADVFESNLSFLSRLSNLL
jgi:hypothetical protein